MRFKNSANATDRIASDLGVSYLLEGSRANDHRPHWHHRPANRNGNRESTVGRTVRARRPEPAHDAEPDGIDERQPLDRRSHAGREPDSTARRTHRRHCAADPESPPTWMPRGAPSFAHRHRRQCSTRDRSSRSPNSPTRSSRAPMRTTGHCYGLRESVARTVHSPRTSARFAPREDLGYATRIRPAWPSSKTANPNT
jgi:hypothetical protein